MAEWRQALRASLGDVVRFDEPLERHTTLKLGGPAEAWVAPRLEDEVVTTLRFVEEHSLSLTILGGGSNVLIADAGVSGVVLEIKNVNSEITRTPLPNGDETWTVGAGMTTIGLVRRAVDAGMKGAEVLAGVPGSIGGAVIMNAGGHDGELKDHTQRVRIADRSGVRWIGASEAGFSYRASRFAQGTVVLGVELCLHPTEKTALDDYVKQHMARRRQTQPLDWPNAGSFFKNPQGDYAGRLIESCGLKGTRVGCAEVSSLHANFLVKARDVTSASPSQDFVKLIDLVRQQVWSRHGIWLELEVRPIGEFSAEERRTLGASKPEGGVS